MTAPPSHQTSRRSRQWIVAGLTCALAVVLALALVITLVLTDRSGDDPVTAADGQVLQTSFNEPPPEGGGQVLTPWALYDVAIGSPQDHLPEILVSRPANLSVPEGGSAVRLDVNTVDGYGLPYLVTAASPAPELEVTLRADGRTYRLDGPGGVDLGPTSDATGHGTRWVALAGPGDGLELVVSIDGEEQTVHPDGTVDLGRAEALDVPTTASPLQQTTLDCGRPRRADSWDRDLADHSRDELCTLRVLDRVPYVSGLGWAPQGRAYLGVIVTQAITIDLEDDPEDEPRRLRVSRITGTLDGTGPAAGPTSTDQLLTGAAKHVGSRAQTLLVFEVDDTDQVPDLDMTMTIDAVAADPFSTQRDDLELQWTFPGRKLS